MLTPSPAQRASYTAAAKVETARAAQQAAENKVTVKKSAATAAKPNDASASLCQKLPTDCQACSSADAYECYHIAHNLNPNYFASTGKSGDSVGSGPCFLDAGFSIIGECGFNAASGEKTAAQVPQAREAAETKAAPCPPAAATQAIRPSRML